ncbi:MAG: TraB family protein [Thermoplasmata archaeon]
MSSPEIKEYSDDIILAGLDYLGDDILEEELLEWVSEYRPKTVAFALCDKRFEALGGRDWDEQPLLPSYKEGKTGVLIYQAFTEALRENLRRFKDISAETNVARLVPFADELDVDVELIDRDISLTLGRAFKVMKPGEKLKMFWYLKSTMLTFSDEKRKKSVDKMEKHDDLVGGVIERVSNFAPGVARVASKEREEYMGKKIYESSKEGRVLALVPMSKMEPVMKEIDDAVVEEKSKGEHSGFEHLERISKKFYTKGLKFISPAFFISLAIYLFIFSDTLNFWRALQYWFLAIGGMAALGALLGRGHPISVLTSFLLAPVMALTLIGPGWIAGYVELKVRNPSIADLKSLTSSESTNEFLSNNIIRVFTVGIFSNIFTWMGIGIVLPLLLKFVG